MEFENLLHARNHLEDAKDELDEAKKTIQRRMQKRMQELGISKERVNKSYFKEFNIKDMSSWKGNVCAVCAMGLKCQKHGLNKRYNKLHESQIDKALQRA